MFKRTLLALLIAMPLCVFAQKFGMVSIQNIMINMPEYTAAMKELEATGQKYEAELKKMSDEFQIKYKEFETLAADPNTPDAIKQRREQELQEMYTKSQQYQQSIAEDLQKQQEMALVPLQSKILDAVKAIGQEGGYVFIYPTGATIYQGPMVEDVTPVVAERLGVTLTQTVPQQ